MISESNARSPLVVFAEDDDPVRLNVAEPIEEAGYEVIDVPDAHAALEAIAGRTDVRVLFTDIEMPGGIDGLDLARMVHERWPKVLLLITSGRVAPRKEEIADHGHFLAKPYSAQQVLNEIAGLEKEAEVRQRTEERY